MIKKQAATFETAACFLIVHILLLNSNQSTLVSILWKLFYGNVEALLRTHVQYCENVTFIFSGSAHHMMGEIFTSPKRPFYQSTTLYSLDLLPREKYSEFCKRLFEKGNKRLEDDVVPSLYERFDGVTYYMQRILPALMDKDLVTIDKGKYMLCDKFLELWICEEG